MLKHLEKEYLSLLRSVQTSLHHAKQMGSAADLTGLDVKMSRANELAQELGKALPFEDALVGKIKGMQDRLKYYRETGLDAPSLSDG